MARPTKYNKKTVDLLKKFLRDGFTIRQACYGADISEDTFSRWRIRYPEFNKAVNEATNRQWESSLSLAKYGCRTYKRPSRPTTVFNNISEKPQENFESRLHAFVNGDKNEASKRKFHGLPKRYMTMGAEKLNTYYYDPSNGLVFWKDNGGITRSMRYETYLRKTNSTTQDYYFGEII